MVVLTVAGVPAVATVLTVASIRAVAVVPAASGVHAFDGVPSSAGVLPVTDVPAATMSVLSLMSLLLLVCSFWLPSYCFFPCYF